MSLARRELNGVHPWVAARIDYILDYADQWGPNYSITSGVRTAQEQWELFSRPNTIAAEVGCSQHQYGFAVDVWFEDPAWQQWYLSSARNFGLTTIPGDPVHIQAIPGRTFRQWTSAAGACPDPRYPTSVPIDTELEVVTFWVPSPSGSLSFRYHQQIRFPMTFE